MAVLTRRHYGRVGLLILAAALLVAMLVFIPATNASDGITIESDAGVILLSTGPDAVDNWIRYYENPSVPFDVKAYDKVQYVGVDRRCNVTTPIDDPDYPEEVTLLNIEASPSSEDIGLVSNGFGVRTKNNCATSNGQIDTTQSLTFSLAVGDVFDESHAIDRIEVDVEGKQNATLGYDLTNDMGLNVGSEDDRPIKSASDNGADAGVGDNTVVVITGDETTSGSTELFTSVTLYPTGNDKALVSIEGGGDGAAPIEALQSRLYRDVAQTLFRIVTTQDFDGELLCDGPRPPTSIAPGGPALPGTTVERLEDLKLNGDCTEDAIPYNFQIQDEFVYFDYLDSGEGAQFVVKIEWAPYDPAVYPLNPPVRRINWIDENEENYRGGVACLGFDGDGNPDHPLDPDAADPEATVPWCIIRQTLDLTEDGWQQIQWWHGQGDPRWK